MHIKMHKLYTLFIYGVIFSSLFLIDHLQGSGFVDVLGRLFCKVVCYVKKVIRDEKLDGFNMPILISEVAFLGLTMAFLRKLRQVHSKDRIDDLLRESKCALRQADEFLEKWRIRKINWQEPSETYLDEVPQEIQPLRVEVPILHMAIVDTGRNQFERGDAGNHISDSELLSGTSLLEDDLQSIPDIDDKVGNIENNRFLWDVLEEDLYCEE